MTETITIINPNVQKLLKDTINDMVSLYCRYLDEKDYEPLESYGTPIQRVLERQEGVTFIKMTGRPWGCRFTMGGNTYQYRVTLTQATIKRVA